MKQKYQKKVYSLCNQSFLKNFHRC